MIASAAASSVIVGEAPAAGSRTATGSRISSQYNGRRRISRTTTTLHLDRLVRARLEEPSPPAAREHHTQLAWQRLQHHRRLDVTRLAVEMHRQVAARPKFGLCRAEVDEAGALQVQ